jgi:hypothetical protein
MLARSENTSREVHPRGGLLLAPQLHAELALLVGLFYSDEISDEEWALLQIHMAYCEECHKAFLTVGGP